ncbi:MAG TPA: hypothetical protein VN958_17855 [Chitinophagaceae bacterium]|nr:hypothetical protein [Chitinophagaceae bacterium]
MDIGTLLIIVIAGLINFLILYYIISSATMSKLRNWHERVQTNLLAKIAEKQGVSQEEIKQCFNKSRFKTAVFI